jgi:DMSO/TMAO reductase YedYZ molybdopterin-dependent catalytic subunit
MAVVSYSRIGAFREIRSPVRELTSFVTPEEQLFVLAHLGVPLIDPEDWRLRVGGLAALSLELTLSELHAMPAVELTAFHKCVGNPLKPSVPTPDRVGNVVWRGVVLRDLLDMVRPASNRAFVWASGLDGGSFEGVAVPAYCKDLPWAKASSPEVLVAYAMNGEPLTPQRGGPVRLVVPGWYGTNSVKWLTELTIADRRSPGPFTTRWYNDPIADADGAIIGTTPVWGVAPDSVIVSPGEADVIAADRPLFIRGWAWGEQPIVEVAISIARSDYSWQPFEAEMPSPGGGPYALISRAQDASGRTQPKAGKRNAAVPVYVQIS